MESVDLKVTKEEQFATYRQVLTPCDQSEVVPTLTALISLFRAGRITGDLSIVFNQGGVRKFVTNQVATIAVGSEADRTIEPLFGK